MHSVVGKVNELALGGRDPYAFEIAMPIHTVDGVDDLIAERLRVTSTTKATVN